MAVIALYEIGTTEDFAATLTTANVTASLLSQNDAGIGLWNQNNLGYTTDPEIQVSPQVAGSTSAAAITNGAYFFWTITPDVGYTISYASVKFKAARGGASTNRGWTLQASHDTFGSNLGNSAINTQRATWTNYTVNLSTNTALSGVGEITFRFYVWTAASTSSIEVDDIQIEGTVNAPAGGIKYTQLERFTRPRGIIRGVYYP